MKSTKIHLMIAFAAVSLLTLIACNQIETEESHTLPAPKKTSVIIVGHGSLPNDFPKIKEYFEAINKHGHGHGHGHSHGDNTDEAFAALEHALIYWPRTEQNDKYWAGFMKIVKAVEQSDTYHSVHHAFNEFCAPTITEALAEAVKTEPNTIILTSIMMTPGGGHSEKDIPVAIEAFKKNNPNVNVNIVYAWPYDVNDISGWLITQTNKFIPTN